MYRTSSEHVPSLQFSCTELSSNSMNNHLLYCWLVDARISASDKDLPVPKLKDTNTKLENKKFLIIMNT